MRHHGQEFRLRRACLFGGFLCAQKFIFVESR
jgi:hypothetical protein